ncbi:MAG: hypothetical protein DMF59_10875 [Acidobacteria bacterium]|nr:MAG: hypothetical protein DMF59_10875 [Acidobacteriota bacterium]
MSRGEKAIVAGATLILLIAFIARLYTRGGPYFQRPLTIVDHVGPGKHETRDALLLLPKVRPLLPRGARVTCFEPGNRDTMPDFFAAVGQLPRQIVVSPNGDLPEYVIAIRQPFTNTSYRVIAQFPEGRLYRRD